MKIKKIKKDKEINIIEKFKKISFKRLERLLINEFNYIYINELRAIDDNLVLTRDEKIIIDSICDSFEVIDKLIKKEKYIEAICIIRNSFEQSLICLTINEDDDYYEAFIKSKKDRNKDERELIKPINIRKRVDEIMRELYDNTNFEWYDWKKNLDDYYSELCELVHPSILKNFLYNMIKDNENDVNIKIVIRKIELYTRFIFLAVLKVLNNHGKIDELYDTYFLLSSIFLLQFNNKEYSEFILENSEYFLHKEVNLSLFKDEENNDYNLESFEFVIKFLTFLHTMGFSLNDINRYC